MAATDLSEVLWPVFLALLFLGEAYLFVALGTTGRSDEPARVVSAEGSLGGARVNEMPAADATEPVDQKMIEVGVALAETGSRVPRSLLLTFLMAMLGALWFVFPKRKEKPDNPPAVSFRKPALVDVARGVHDLLEEFTIFHEGGSVLWSKRFDSVMNSSVMNSSAVPSSQLDSSVIKLGPLTLLTVDEGCSAITQNNGEQVVLAGGDTHLLTHCNWKFEKFVCNCLNCANPLNSGANPLNVLIGNVLLESRSGEKSFEHGSHMMKWVRDTQLGLVFVCMWPKALQVLYIDELLDTVKKKFTTGFEERLASEDFGAAFEFELDGILRKCESEAMERKVDKFPKRKEEPGNPAAVSFRKPALVETNVVPMRNVARRRYLRTGIEAAQLRLALGSLLHHRLASYAAITDEHAPALVDLLFAVGTQPQLQFCSISLKLLTFRESRNLRSGASSGFRLQPSQTQTGSNHEELPLPARMPLAELLQALRNPRRSDISFKAYRGPLPNARTERERQLRVTSAIMLHDLDQDDIATLDDEWPTSTVEQFVTVDGCCLMKLIPFHPPRETRETREWRGGRMDIGRFASHYNSPGRQYLSADGAKHCTSGSLKMLLAMAPSANHAATFYSTAGPVLAPSACSSLVRYLDNLK
jgi:hypothetical protein